MALDKIALTLYDLLGYLIPGYVWLLNASLLEANYGHSSLLSFAAITENTITFALVAYFLGHLSHAVGSLLRARWHTLFSDGTNRLCPAIQECVRQHLAGVYGIPKEACDSFNNLDVYLLTDAYVMASGVDTDREVLMAREGFHNAAMVAFAGLSLTLVAILVLGDVQYQLAAGTKAGLGIGPTIALLVLAVSATLLFRQRFAFHARVKVNTSSLLFLAMHARDTQKGKE